MTASVKKNFRIAFREDGAWWRCYFTSSLDSMKGAVELASVRINLMRGDPVMQEAFKDFAKLAMNKAIVEVIGPDAKVTMWDEMAAPEGERGAPP
jgi:hypothetical protein